MVTHIDDDGYVSFDTIGGWDHQVFVGQRVRLLGRAGPVDGVVGKKAIHLMEKDDREKVSKVEDLWIDIGAASRAEAERAAPHRRPRRARGRGARVSQRPAGEPLHRQPDRRVRRAGGAPAAWRERRGRPPRSPRSRPRGKRSPPPAAAPAPPRPTARARRRDRGGRHPCDRLPRHRQAQARRLPAGRRAGPLRGAPRSASWCSSCWRPRRRRSRSPTPSRRRRATPTPTPRRSSTPTAESRRRWCRSPTATCTAPTRWSRWKISTGPPGCSPRSRAGSRADTDFVPR